MRGRSARGKISRGKIVRGKIARGKSAKSKSARGKSAPSKSARGKNSRSLRRTRFPRTMNMFYSYFLKDGRRILNCVFLLEAMSKCNNETESQLK